MTAPEIIYFPCCPHCDDHKPDDSLGHEEACPNEDCIGHFPEGTSMETGPFLCCVHCTHDPKFRPNRHRVPCPSGCSDVEVAAIESEKKGDAELPA